MAKLLKLPKGQSVNIAPGAAASIMRDIFRNDTFQRVATYLSGSDVASIEDILNLGHANVKPFTQGTLLAGAWANQATFDSWDKDGDAEVG